MLRMLFLLLVLVCSMDLRAQEVDSARTEWLVKDGDSALMDLSFMKDDSSMVRVDMEDPVFKGDMHQFIREHMQYPEDARKAGVKGTVVLYVHFNALGRIDEKPIVLQPLYPSLDQEAIRLVQLMPDWEPAYMLLPKTTVKMAVEGSLRISIPFE